MKQQRKYINMAKNEKAAQNFIGEMNKTAEELFKIRKALQPREEKFEELKKNFEIETRELYAKENELKQQLIEKLNTIGLKSIKVQSGDSVSMVKTRRLEILNDQALLKWAIANELANPDKTRIKIQLETMVKEGQEMPAFAKLTEVDSIRLNMPTVKAKK